MPLGKQTFPVSFTRSLSARISDKLILPGRLTTASDVIWRGTTVERRTGFTSLATAILGSTNLTNLKKGYTFGSELDVQGDSFWSWSSQNSTWTSMGRGFDLNAISKTVFARSHAQIVEADVVKGGGYTAYVWRDTNGVCSAQVIDEATGVNINDGPTQLEGSSVVLPRVLYFANIFMALWYNGTNIRFSTWNPSSPNSGWSAAATVIASSAQVFDALVISNRAFFVYAGASAAIAELNSSGTVITGPAFTGANYTQGALFMGSSQDGFLYLIGARAGHLRRFIYNLSLTQISGETDVDTNMGSSTVSVGYYSNTSSCDIFYGYKPTDSYITSYCKLSSNGTVGSVQVFMRGAVVASHAFVYNSKRYIWLSPNWGIASGAPNASVTVGQSMILVEDTKLDGTAARMSAQAMLGTGRTLVSGATYNRVTQVPTDNNAFPFTVAPEQFILNLSGGINTSAVGLSRLTAAPQGASPITAAKLGGVIVTGGGFLSIYDGLNPVELGFLQYPELVKLAAVGSGGSLSAGTYQVALTYEWVDLTGNRWQSAATAAQSVVAVNSDSITVTMPTLRQTNKISPRALPRIVVWRTAVNGSTLYRDSSLTASTANDTTVDTKTYTIVQADSAVTSNEVLYTAGALANIAPPAGKYVWSHQGRLFITGMEDPNLVWYSRKYVANGGINFNDTLTLQINPWGGINTGGASLDDKCIIFQQTATVYVYGDGPDPLGNNNSFSTPQLASRDVGCVDARTVAVIPLGAVFLSLKGFYLLDRGLQMRYIGASVENTVNPFGAAQLVFTSAQVLTAKNQVRWTTAGGTCLVLDYTDALAMDVDPANMDVYKWSTLTNYAANDSVIWQNAFTQIGSDSAICQDSDSTNSDTRIVAGATTTSGIAGIVETAWIHVAGIQGFKRVWRTLIAGMTAGGAHSPTVSVGFNYNPTYSYTFSTPFSIPMPGGGFISQPLPTAEPLQIRHGLKTQLMESVRFKIAFSAESNQAPWRLEDLSLECGMKKGAFKLPPGATL